MPKNISNIPPCALIYGSDEFTVSLRARELFNKHCSDAPGIDQEIIDANAENQADALKALYKLMEALNTLPFFGSVKVIWFKGCNFFSENKLITTEKVWETQRALAETLQKLGWQDVRLVVSANDIDKRRPLYKAFEKVGSVEEYQNLSAQDKDWEAKAVAFVEGLLKKFGKSATDNAIYELVHRIGPDLRLLTLEVEKLCAYTGNRTNITLKDIDDVCSNNKLVRAFALADALGRRDTSAVMKHLEDEFWSLQFDRDKSEISTLYGLISKVRAMLIAKELISAKIIKPGMNYISFKNSVKKFLETDLPDIKIHEFILFKAIEDCKNYSREELLKAMELLLECNRAFVSTGQDKKIVLQQTLVKILTQTTEKAVEKVQ